MTKELHENLSRRERQMMDIIYKKGSASVAEVMAALPDPPSYSAVRTILRILEEKGHLKHKEEGVKYIFSPTLVREKAERVALKRLLKTFFDGSTEQAVATLLDISSATLSKSQLDRLAQRIDQARKEGR